ncbi:MAG: sigma-54-dependent Fis family transcriptional regulator [Candidatus Krumholzibacteriota bacterium]|nr:sigma-54-dependent Fis family transcriptional regulator [Candidatus Krumholzibacteriota bacterium]
MEKKILVVEDMDMTREFLIDVLSEYKVDAVSNVKSALKQIENTEYDLVISDVRLPEKGEGVELLKIIKNRCPDTIVIIMTGFGSVEEATESIRLGAYDYIQKPFTIDELNIKIKNAFNFSSMRTENRDLKRKLDNKPSGGGIIGKSEKLEKILDTVDMIADTRATVLITGENGTGKELVARRIHSMSGRKDKPFVKINCAAIPEGTLESELFGHEKGSFTSAHKVHPGKFEQADTGTLLLDEIGEIPPHIQAKLLRVLQEREIDRVGGKQSIPVNVRIISTTNKNLLTEIREKRFREDLYYRLNVVNIEVPPLRERRDDIALLAEHFIRIYCAENDKEIKKMSKGALKKLENCPWRGNIRELENWIERAVILCQEDMINEDSFMFNNSNSIETSKVEAILKSCTIAAAERLMIEERLKKFSSNRTRAAMELGISVRTLRNKLKLYKEEDSFETAISV